MKKTTFYLLFAMLTLLSIDLYSQCIPTGVRPVFGTVTGSTGTQTFTNIPTGNVIQFTAPAVGVFYTISLCATNPANTPDGTNDSYLTMLSANSAAATSLGFADDGCTTNIPNGWGPTTMTWTSTAVGNTFLYLTEYNAAATAFCVADGVNAVYDMTVTKTAAPPACNAGVLTSTTATSICPGATFTVTTNGTQSTAGGYGVFFSPQAGATGAFNNDFIFSGITFPFTFDNDLNGVLSGQPTPLPSLQGTWAIYSAAYSNVSDAFNSICDTSNDSVLVTFLTSGSPGCAPVSCNNGNVAASLIGTTQNICPGDSVTLATDGTQVVPAGETYGWFFQSNTNVDSFYIITGPTNYFGDLNAALTNDIPFDSYTVSGFATDSAQAAICGGALTVGDFTVNFLAPTDPLCSGTAGTPCVTAANTYNNLITAGGAPCNDGTGCTPTSAGFTTFGIYGSEAYQLSGVQAGFDYVFNMCSGFGAGAWIPAITIVAPSGAVDTFNLGTTGTFAANCSLPWTASESGLYTIVIHEAGLPCGTETLIDNGNPIVTCGTNAATCLPCTPGVLTSPASMVVCSNSSDSLVLNGTESTPGSYSVAFTSAGGTGGQTGGFSIVNITEFPWVFDNDLSGVLSANSLPVLSGLWNLEIYNVDASDLICDSVAQIITVNFVDSTSPLCQTNLQPGDCEDLILSEMIEGTSNNKCIELYNPTDLPIDLATGGYQITVYTNGSATGTVTALSGVVPAEGTFVICNASAGAAFTALADVVGGAMNGATFFNGDDAVALSKNSGAIVLDIYGQIGFDPGTAWTSTSGCSTANLTMVRNVDVLTGDIVGSNVFDPSAEWTCLSVDNVSNLGMHSSECVASCAITNIVAGTQTACNPATNTFSQNLIITYSVPPTTGMLVVEGQSFPITSSPQTVTLTNLPADGTIGNDVLASFSALPSCDFAGNSVYNAPASCACLISDISAGVQTACNVSNNTFTQAITVTYTTPPTSGMLVVNGQSFAITSSPQTVILTNLQANGPSSNDVSASFSALPACSYSENNVFNTPASCACLISDVDATVQTPCVNTTNTYTQAVIVTYSNAPTSGNLVVNGQSFAITSSPQTVVLTNLPSNGASVNITAAFSAVPACTYTLNSAFTAPAGCLCPTINVSVTATTPVTNCTAPNGSITVAANGGTGSFTYAWTPSAFGSGTTLTNIPSGTYSVIATDGNGCTGSTSGSVTNASGVNALISNVSNVSCFNGNNGVISISTTGGTAPISFTWSDQGFASTIASRTNLVAGSYVIAVSDAGGCSVVLGPINITQPNQLVATVDNSSNVTCAGLTNGAINVTTTGGNGGNQYVWTNGGGSTEDISGLAAGSYQLTVTDNKGCQATTSSVTITAPSAILITTNSQSNVSCFGAADADILVTVTGGTGAYDFDWNNAPDMEDVLNVGPGSYQLTVTDANNCVQTSPNFTVTQPQQLVVNIVSQENVSCNGANDGQIVASATGGTGVLDILWTNGAGTSLTASNLAPNSYQLSVTDDNNCSVTTNITTITQPSILIALATSTPSAVGGSTGTATATPSGGTAPYTYKWSDPNAQTTSAATGLSAGSYTCLVTDANGCTTTIPVSVGVADAIGELALKSLKVYPNPNNGVFTIQFETTESLDFEIKLLNTIGKEVYVQTYSNVNGIFTEQFAFNQLASGIYFLEISNNDSKSVTRISINK